MEGFLVVWEGFGAVWEGLGQRGRVWSGVGGFGAAWEGFGLHRTVWGSMEGFGAAWEGLGRPAFQPHCGRNPCLLVSVKIQDKRVSSDNYSHCTDYN